MIQLRQAEPGDVGTIADFNCRLAAETEQKQLDPATVTAGVAELIAIPHRGRYFVAVAEGQVVGQMMHTYEWSDWRNGDIWWLQSVYVLPEFRGQGVFRALFQHLRDEAQRDPGVVGLRLYAEDHNQRAHEVYDKLGMRPAGYSVRECMLRRQV